MMHKLVARTAVRLRVVGQNRNALMNQKSTSPRRGLAVAWEKCCTLSQGTKIIFAMSNDPGESGRNGRVSLGVGARLRALFVGLALIFLLSIGIAAEPEAETVCVASRADTPFRGQVVPPTGEVSSGGLQVKVDRRPAVPWPQRESLKIEGLDVKERHLLAVVDSHGKPVESLWFRFASYKSVHLWMSHDGYQGMGLQEDARCPWCRCK